MWLRNKLLADIHQERLLTREEVRLSRETRDGRMNGPDSGGAAA